MKILLVEDEPEMASAISDVLHAYNMVVEHAATLALARQMALAGPADILIVDRQLPDGDGLAFVRWLRAQGDSTPVLVLTALGDLAERVAGLDVGADDYLAKPFATEELLARLRALSRRPAQLKTDIVTVGRLDYDFGSHLATVATQPVDLKRRELLVLEALMRRFGRMVTREALMNAVFSMDDNVQPNALDTSVSRLRRKLADADAGVVINVVRGLGFMLRSAQ
ncbi:Transcriptional regulatory protein QseB [compost metagenome]